MVKDLPDELLALPNSDKEFHEEWDEKRNILNIPHPFRCVALGPPNSGKGTVCKNLILRADPPFQEIYCIHCDPEYTTEWDDVDAKMLKDIPKPDEWPGLVKTLVVLDDLEFKGMNKDQKHNLDRLFGFCSTHKNISIILCAQDAFNVPPIVRRCSNLWILWRCPDLDAMSCVSRKAGIKSNNFNSMFDQLDINGHSSLWLDMTDKSPYPMRKNGYQLIKKQNNQNDLRIK